MDPKYTSLNDKSTFPSSSNTATMSQLSMEEYSPSTFAATPRNNYNYSTLNTPGEVNTTNLSTTSLAGVSSTILTDDEEFDKEQRLMWIMNIPKLQTLVEYLQHDLFIYGLNKAALYRLLLSLGLSLNSKEVNNPLMITLSNLSTISSYIPSWLTLLTDVLHAKAHTLKFLESIQNQLNILVPGYRGACLQGKGPLRASRSLVW